LAHSLSVFADNPIVVVQFRVRPSESVFSPLHSVPEKI
jgi:hypothetical protein